MKSVIGDGIAESDSLGNVFFVDPEGLVNWIERGLEDDGDMCICNHIVTGEVGFADLQQKIMSGGRRGGWLRAGCWKVLILDGWVALDQCRMDSLSFSFSCWHCSFRDSGLRCT